MKLHVNFNQSLKDIQKEFHDEFPALKLEFFKKPHSAEAPSSKEDLLSNSLKTAKVAKAEGELKVTGKSKVYEIEQLLRKKFGLYAQIFRKSGDVWLETTTTDGWTLEQQQQAAKESGTTYIHSTHNFADERD